MGFYIRKSFSFGPLRLNLSKSGLGYSFGVKGARVGSGPRGNYIHLGRYGLYYRHSLSTVPAMTTPSGQDSPRPSPRRDDPAVLGTVIPNADVTGLHDSAAEELLDYVRAQCQKTAYAPWMTVAATFLIGLMLAKQIVLWLIAACIVLVLIAYWMVSQCDRTRKRKLHKKMSRRSVRQASAQALPPPEHATNTGQNPITRSQTIGKN